MSDTVITKGVVFPLKDGIVLDVEAVSEELYDLTNGKIDINYEGTLIVVSETTEDIYFLHLGGDNNSIQPYVEQINNFEHKHLINFDDIEFDKASSFVNVWYNGVDSDYNMLTREEYFERLNG